MSKHPGGRPLLPTARRNRVQVMVDDTLYALLPKNENGKPDGKALGLAWSCFFATPETWESVREGLNTHRREW